MTATITLTQDEFETRIRAAVEMATSAAVAALVSAQKQPSFEQQVRERRGEHLPKIDVTLVEGCIAPSGATFTAEIQRNIVVTLQDYRHPDGVETCVDDGGLVPNGFQIRDLTSGLATPMYKQWLYETFLQPDIRAIVGKPLPRHMRPSGERAE
jgi:hypothetical protein